MEGRHLGAFDAILNDRKQVSVGGAADLVVLGELASAPAFGGRPVAAAAAFEIQSAAGGNRFGLTCKRILQVFLLVGSL